MNRRCPRCKEEKSVAEFHKDKSTSSGWSCWCTPCRKKSRADRIAKNRTAHLKQLRKYHLKHAFGMTPEDYTQHLEKQNSRCALCKTDDPGFKMPSFPIDHNHATGQVRGLLCNICNIMVGRVEQKGLALLLDIVPYLSKGFVNV